jgi:hypothetical protein
MTYHLGLPVMDFRYLGSEETIDLVWGDPWYSKFRNRKLWRQYDSPVNVFLYVEPFEVRVEIIARPRDVQEWADVGVGGLKTIPVEIQEDVKQRVAAFFAENLNLTVDGEPISPALDRANFLNRTLRKASVINPPRELDAASATLGVIFVQPQSGYPDEAAVIWELFPDRVERIPAAATDEAGPLPFYLQRDDNVLLWKNFLKNPKLPTLADVEPPPSIARKIAVWVSWIGVAVMASLLLRGGARAAGGAESWARVLVIGVILVALAASSWWATRSVTLDDQRAGEITSALLNNVYRAFDHRDDDAIYDTLEQSVTGDLLTETYLEISRGLELASEGGARAKVKSVDLLEVRAEDAETGFKAHCTWNVSAAVGHWGHTHQRINQYVADLLIEPIDGVWKVTRLELIHEARL